MEHQLLQGKDEEVDDSKKAMISQCFIVYGFVL